MQFTLQSLLLFFVLVWLSLAALGPWGLVYPFVLLALIAGTRAYKQISARWPWARIVAAGLSLVVFAVLFFWSAQQPLNPHRGRRSCVNELKSLALGLHNYHDRHGSFPPAFVCDSSGKPAHSWRVLLLPCLEAQDLYAYYSFAESWDGPNNHKLQAAGSRSFSCPENGRRADRYQFANYVAVVGPEAAWPGERAMKLSEIRSPEKTILLVETVDSDISWMEPRDMTLEEALRGINPPGGRGISSFHGRRAAGFFYRDQSGAFVAVADGGVRFLPADVPPETLKALLSIDADKSKINWDRIEAPRLDWGRIAALAMLVALTFLVLCRAARAMVVTP